MKLITMKLKNWLALLLSACLAAALLTGCGAAQDDDTQGTNTPDESLSDFQGIDIRLGGLKGPTSMGMVKLLADNEAGTTVNHYDFTMAGSADELTPKLLQGELDILAVPVNLGSVLYNNTEGGVQLLAINTLGVLSLVEKGGTTVTDWDSLKGQTIYATGKGSTPEYTLRYLMLQNGIDPDTDVTIEWKSEPSEIVALMAAQEHVIALMPQPFVTVAQSKFSDLVIAMDLTAEWDALGNDSQLITAGLIVRTDFARENPEAIAAFLNEYAASTDYVNANVAEAAQLVGQYEIVDAAVAEQAIPFCNIVCITGHEGKTSAQGYLQILYDQNPKAVGGTLPGEDFYYDC